MDLTPGPAEDQKRSDDACPGPLVWFDAPPGSAVLECAACDYLIVTGNFHDEAHAQTPLMREGLAA